MVPFRMDGHIYETTALLFLASHKDTVNVKRGSIYCITMLMHEIGRLEVSVAVPSNSRLQLGMCISFTPDYECNTIFSVAMEFYNERGRVARNNFRDNLPFASYSH